MKLSIILATYNWPTALDIILQNLLKQIKKSMDVEIIIADDGSGEDTLKIVKKYQAQSNKIKHVWHEDEGFRKSIILNKAVSLSMGDYLIFLDGDCIPFPDFIGEHMRIMEYGYMIAGNRVLLSKKFTNYLLSNPEIVNNIIKWRLFNWIFAKITKSVNKMFPRIKLGNGKWRYRRSQNWKYPKGCNFAVSRSCFMQVNGFDESFAGWGHEDADLFVRLLHSGVKIKDGRFAIPVLHLWHNESSRVNERGNWDRLIKRVDDVNLVKAISGIDQYTQKV